MSEVRTRFTSAPSFDDAGADGSRPTNGRPVRTIRFGSVEVVATEHDQDYLDARARESTEALRRGLEKLLTPGIVIPRVKDVPLYYADENELGKYIRELNGKRERGIMENGDFKVTG